MPASLSSAQWLALGARPLCQRFRTQGPAQLRHPGRGQAREQLAIVLLPGHSRQPRRSQRFHAWADRILADGYAPGAPVLTVALSGRVDLVGSPLGGLIYVAAHQRVLNIDPSGRCRTAGCHEPSDILSGHLDPGDPICMVVESCKGHRRSFGLSMVELEARLPGVQVVRPTSTK